MIEPTQCEKQDGGESHRNQSRSHGVEHNREMAGKPVGQSESAHPADVLIMVMVIMIMMVMVMSWFTLDHLDQVVGAMAVGGQQSEEAE